MDETEFTEVKTWFGTDYIGALRHLRDILLRQSDWTQFRDVTLTKDADWKTYRQSLRDITKDLTTVDDIDKVTWPTKPS